MPQSLFVWLWVLCDLAYLVAGVGMLGPADLIFQQWERSEDCIDCFDNINVSVRQKKYNRSINVLDINIQNSYDLGDNIILELKGFVKKEGGYKPGSLYMKDPACKLVGVLLGDVFTYLLKSTGRDDCPLVAGDHAIKDFHFDNTQFNVPQVYGEYKMEANLFRDEVLEASFNAYYILVPKEED